MNRSVNGAREWWDRRILGLLALFAATFAVYGSSLHNGFVNWDDPLHITDNLDVQQIDLVKIFTVPANNVFHPVAALTWAIEYALVGFEPFLYHLDNLLLHLLNAVLVALLLRKLAPDDPFFVWLGTAIFTLHPLQVEVVAWASLRKDLLCAAFYLGSLLAFLRWRDGGSRGWYALSLGLFPLALLAKPMAVSLPAACYLTAVWLDGKPSRQALLAVLPLVAIAAAILASTPPTIPPPPDTSGLPLYNMGLFERLGIVAKGSVFYLSKFLLPIRLSVFYDIAHVRIQPYELAIAISAAAAIGARVLRTPSARPLALWGALFFGVTWAPVSKLIPFSANSIFNDRYMYMPLIGLTVVFVPLLSTRFAQAGRSRRLSAVIGAALCLVLSFASHGRAGVWLNSETLWRNVIRNYPDTATAHHQLGMYYFREVEDLDRATAAFEAATLADPSFSPAHLRIGQIHERRNRKRLAAKAFERAVAYAPNDPDTRAVTAGFYIATGNLEKAAEHLEAAVLISPVFVKAYNNLAVVYMRMNRLDRAQTTLARAIEVDPELGMSYLNLGDLLARQGNLEAASRAYDEAERRGQPVSPKQRELQRAP